MSDKAPSVDHAEVGRLREALTILCDAHVEIVDGYGLPEDISRDALLRAAAVLNA